MCCKLITEKVRVSPVIKLAARTNDRSIDRSTDRWTNGSMDRFHCFLDPRISAHDSIRFSRTRTLRHASFKRVRTLICFFFFFFVSRSQYILYRCRYMPLDFTETFTQYIANILVYISREASHVSSCKRNLSLGKPGESKKLNFSSLRNIEGSLWFIFSNKNTGITSPVV